MPHEVSNRDGKIKYHTQEDLDRFFAKLYAISPPRDYSLFSLMYYFGLRASEVGLIGLDHLDLRRSRLWITRLKGGVSAEYPLLRSKRLARRLRSYLNSRGLSDRDVLFLSRFKHPISRKQIDVLFKKYGKKGKLPEDRRHAHTLRHSVAVHMLDAGFTAEEVKDRLGHRDIRSTDIYARISSQKRDEIGRRMERANFIVKA